MSFAFADRLGEKVSKRYNNPYEAYKNHFFNNNHKHKNKKELCLVSDNLVIYILDTKMIAVKWSVSCAKHVLHIFEELYPDYKGPRKAIEAASNWIKDPSEQNTKTCYDASKVCSRGASAYAFYAASHAVSSAERDFFDAAYYSTFYSSNESLEIKWQIKKLNQIVYEEILLAFVMTQYIRVDKKLVRKIPKELLKYIASFITG